MKIYSSVSVLTLQRGGPQFNSLKSQTLNYSRKGKVPFIQSMTLFYNAQKYRLNIVQDITNVITDKIIKSNCKCNEGISIKATLCIS